MCLGNFDTHSYAHPKKGNTLETLQKTVTSSVAPEGGASDLSSVSEAVD